MKKYLLKISGLAGLVLLLAAPGFAQTTSSITKDTAANRLQGYDEIVIKHKSEKDAKVTVEIKNGEVFVNGKPISDFDNDDLSVRKKKIKVLDGQTFSIINDGVSESNSPFRKITLGRL